MTTEINFRTNSGEDLNLIFDLEQSLGEGSIAEVYEVTVKGSGEKLALKILKPGSSDEVKKEFEEKSNILSDKNSVFSGDGFVKSFGFNKITINGQERYSILMEHGGSSLYELVSNVEKLKTDFSSQLDKDTRDYLVDKNMYNLFLNLEKLHDKGKTHNDLSLDNVLLGFDIMSSLKKGTLDKDLFENYFLMTDAIPIKKGTRSKTKELSESKYKHSDDFLRQPFGLGFLEGRDKETRERIKFYKKTDVDNAILIFMYLRQGEDAFDNAISGEYGEFLKDELGDSFGSEDDIFNQLARRSTRDIPSAKQIRIALQEKIKKKYFNVAWEGNNPNGVIEKIYRPIDKLMEGCDKLISTLEESPDYNHNDLENELKRLIETDYKNCINWKDHSGNHISPEVKERMKNYLSGTIDKVLEWVNIRKKKLTSDKNQLIEKREGDSNEKLKLESNISGYNKRLSSKKSEINNLIQILTERNNDGNYVTSSSDSSKIDFNYSADGSVIERLNSYDYGLDLKEELDIRANLNSDEMSKSSYEDKIKIKTKKINQLTKDLTQIGDNIEKYLIGNKKKL